MTTQQKEDLSDKILTVDLLMQTLSTIESQIKKCAYNRKKYQYVTHSRESWDFELKNNMKNRTYVTNVLITRYDVDQTAIKDTVSSVDRGIIPLKYVNEIVDLIKSGTYVTID